ncbi:hypothetical protein [Microbulbifer discodermiae]|uniref:hypothetical protein n=1 Tax=Microbulbifer sp. 2201CG32-9 TaxID=3232309 RepID=UPI00345C5DC2
MTIRRIFSSFPLLATIVGNDVLALTNSAPAKISQLTIGSNFVRVQLKSMTEMEGCSQQQYYILDIADNKNSAMLSASLVIRSMGSTVIIQSDGCLNGYSLISHIYY